jgi:hypothetical protein
VRIPAAQLAADYVAASFPAARAAFLGGSAETEYASATSDLDIVIVNGPDGPVLRRTVRHGDRVVEAFVHTVASLEEFVEHEIHTRRRSSLLHMCAEGRLLVDTDGLGTALQLRCRRRLEAGPPPLSAAEDEDRRYGITDLLDDLAGCTDPAELVFVAGAALQALAELILLRIGSGRRRASGYCGGCGPGRPSWPICWSTDGYRRSVVDADPGSFCAAAADVLERYGGRVQEGYERVASR